MSTARLEQSEGGKFCLKLFLAWVRKMEPREKKTQFVSQTISYQITQILLHFIALSLLERPSIGWMLEDAALFLELRGRSFRSIRIVQFELQIICFVGLHREISTSKTLPTENASKRHKPPKAIN
jgi:hypothetical protein